MIPEDWLPNKHCSGCCKAKQPKNTWKRDLEKKCGQQVSDAAVERRNSNTILDGDKWSVVNNKNNNNTWTTFVVPSPWHSHCERSLDKRGTAPIGLRTSDQAN